MAFFNDLVRTVALVEGLDEMTVRGIGIRVREGDFISKGGRGLSAAKMTASDASSLLIGVNAGSNASRSAETVNQYRSLPLADMYPSKSKAKAYVRDLLSQRKGFGGVLEDLISLCRPTLGNVDLLAHIFSKNLNLGKEMREQIESGKAFDDVLIFEISFERPHPAAVVEIKNAVTSEVVLRAHYTNATRKDEFDRSEITKITQKTLRAVGMAL